MEIHDKQIHTVDDLEEVSLADLLNLAYDELHYKKQYQLAKKLKLSSAYLSQLMRGQKAGTRIETRLRAQIVAMLRPRLSSPEEKKGGDAQMLANTILEQIAEHERIITAAYLENAAEEKIEYHKQRVQDLSAKLDIVLNSDAPKTGRSLARMTGSE
jgi:transcriptional regulator with XRE-family HTH domain